MRTTATRCGHLICVRTPHFEQDIPEEQWPDQFRLQGMDRTQWSHRTCGLASLGAAYGLRGEARPAATIDDLRSCLESTGGPLIASVTLRFSASYSGRVIIFTDRHRLACGGAQAVVP
jgi:hypothetical protein